MIVSFDAETWLIQPGLAVPKPVVFSFKVRGKEPWLLLPDEACEYLEERIDADDILLAHNLAFDASVAAEYRPSLLPKIFLAYERGQMRCTKLRQMLIDISVGRRKNPTTKKKEVWRPDENNGEGAWVKPDYTLAGSPKVEGSTGLVGLYFKKDRSHQKGSDGWRLRYGELDGLPLAKWPKDAQDYALEDAVDALDVFDAQQTKYASRTSDPDAPLVNEVEQCRAAFALRLVSAWGMRTNPVTLDKLEAECNRVAKEVRERLIEKNIFRYKGPKKDPKREIVKNTKEIQRRVKEAFETLGLDLPVTKPSKRAPNGQIKTDKDTLILSGDPDLVDLAEAGPADTVRRTFVPALLGGVDFPINTTYDEILDNGRISSSSPNLANIPRGDILEKLIGMDVRSAVEPRPGFGIVSIDYDCAELRSHAQVNTWLAREKKWPEPEMAKFFQANPHGDPHLEAAAFALDLSGEEAKKLKEAGDKRIKAVRQAKKASNFGLPGGMGPAKLIESARKGYGVKMAMPEAKKERELWKKRWPEMERYLDYISENTESGPWTVTQYISGRVRGQCGYSDAANTLWSGLTADGAKHALWRVVYECYVDLGTPLFGCRVIGFLYDELLLEVPMDILHEAAVRATDIMISAMREYLPDIPVTASPAAMTKWIKSAEAKYDSSGRLVPWDLA